MSIDLMSRVWNEAPYEGSDLLVLLACADAANDDGYFWHGMPKLAAKARMTVRGMRTQMSRFVDSGVIVRDERTGHSNVWQFVIPDTWREEHDAMVREKQEREKAYDPKKKKKRASPHSDPANPGTAIPTPADTSTEDDPGTAVPPITVLTPEPPFPGTPEPLFLRGRNHHSPHPGTTVPTTPERPFPHNHLLTVSEPTDESSDEPRAGAREENPSPVDDEPKLREHPLLWRAVVGKLAGVTAGQRANWLDRCRLAECDGYFVLLAASSYARDFVTQRWGDAIGVYLRELARSRGLTYQGLDIAAPPAKPKHTETPPASYSQALQA